MAIRPRIGDTYYMLLDFSRPEAAATDFMQI